MTWFKVDDKLFGHPEGQGRRHPGHGSVGHVWCVVLGLPDRRIRALRSFVKEHRFGEVDAVVLVEVGLWHPVDGGWQFHDWAQSNPTRTQVEAGGKKPTGSGREQGAVMFRCESARNPLGTHASPDPTRTRPV